MLIALLFYYRFEKRKKNREKSNEKEFNLLNEEVHLEYCY